MEDLNQDTLIYSQMLAVDIAMWQLFRKKVVVRSLELRGVAANVYRPSMGDDFNYQFVIDAFAGTQEGSPEPEEMPPGDEDSGGWEVRLKHILLENIRLKYLDEPAGDDFALHLGLLSTRFLDFDLNTLSFYPDVIEIRDTRFKGVQSQPFAPSTAETDDEVAMPDIRLNRLAVANVNIDYVQHAEGMEASVSLGSLDIDVRELKLPEQLFALNEIRMDESAISYRTWPVPVTRSAHEMTDDPAGPGTATLPEISIGKVELTALTVAFDDEISGTLAQGDIGSFLLIPEMIDLNRDRYELETILLHNSDIRYESRMPYEGLTGKDHYTHERSEPQRAIPTNEETDAGSTAGKFYFGPSVLIKNIDLNNNYLEYLDHATMQGTRSFDPGHIRLSGLGFLAEQVVLDHDQIRADISRAEFRERSGLQLDSLAGSILVTDTAMHWQELYLKTAHSRLRSEFKAVYPAFNTVMDNPGQMVIMFEADAMIDPEDLRIYDEELITEYGLEEYLGYPVMLSTLVNGRLDSLHFTRLDGKMLAQTGFSMPGILVNVTDPDKLKYHFPDIYVSTTANDLYLLMADAVDQETVHLPETYELTGFARGTADSMQFDLALSTGSGNMEAEGNLSWVKDHEYFSVSAATEQLKIGALLNMGDTLGPLTMQASLDGTGFDPATMRIGGSFNIDTASYLEYGYHKISGSIEGEGGLWQIAVSSPNEHLNFDLSLDADFRDTTLPVFRYDLELRQLTAHAVYPMEDEITARFKSKGTVWGTDPFLADVQMETRELVITWNEERLRADSLILELAQFPDSVKLHFISDYLSMLWESNINFEDLPRVMREHINHYVPLFDPDSIAVITDINGIVSDTLYVTDTTETDRYFVFEAEILNTSLFTNFLMPDLERMVPQRLEARYSQNDRNMAVDIRFPAIIYGDYTIDSIAFTASSDFEAMHYALTVGAFSYGTYTIKHLSIAGDLSEGRLNNVFNIRDEEGKDRFLLGGYMEIHGDSIIYSIREDQFILEYEPWQVSPSNLLVYSSNGIRAEEFIFSREEQMFGLSNLVNDDLEFVIRNFELDQISKIINQEENIVAGRISGTALIRLDSESLYFESEISVKDLEYYDQYVGDVTATVHTPVENRYEIDLQLTADDYHGRLRGYYELTGDGEDAISMDVEIYNLNFAITEPFADTYIEDLSGNITGELNITGSSSAPRLNGYVQFNEAAFYYPMLGNRFVMNQERIRFDHSGMHMEQFVLRDADGNRATLSGSVLMTDFSNYDLNLSLRAANFRVIDTEEWIEDMYRGRLIADAQLDITGNQDLPRVNGTITVKSNTRFFLMIPAYEATLAEMEGIVEFVDLSEYDPDDFSDTLAPTTALKGFQVAMVIQSEPDAQFSVFIDPSGNDILQFRGNAELDLDINPAGVMNLTGRYEIAEGSYQLLFMGLVPRRFAVVPGSSITWQGDIMKPRLDIQALYTVRASPENLLRGRLAEVPPQARQAYPFTVQLNMSDELMSPDISFGIELAEEARGAVPGLYPIIQELNQDQQINELNKQVFSLIVLNSFLAQDPLSGSGGGGSSAAARRSVSNVLTQQLNRLASKYVTGFDLSIGIESYEDFTTGEADGRTEVIWGISRRFFDDRLKIEVGGSVDVEGEQSREQQEFSDIAGNLSAEYSLGEARRFRIRAFREQTFENVIDGQLIQTGFGLIYVRDYNRLRDLFRRAAEEAEQD